MQNGQENHAAAAAAAPQPMQPQPMQVNPQQAAAFGLEFLERVSHTRAERERFDVAQALMSAIMRGQVVLASPPPAVAAAPEAEAPAATQ